MNIKYEFERVKRFNMINSQKIDYPLQHTEIINYCLLKSIATYDINCHISLSFPLTQQFINLHSVLIGSIIKNSFNLTSQLSASWKIFQIFLSDSVLFCHFPYNCILGNPDIPVARLFLTLVNQLLLAFSESHIARQSTMYEHISAICFAVTVVYDITMSCQIRIFF